MKEGVPKHKKNRQRFTIAYLPPESKVISRKQGTSPVIKSAAYNGVERWGMYSGQQGQPGA